jgi:hypothetical protein
MSKIKTFRGQLNDGAQERIRLETLDGKKGYKIKKLQIMPIQPGRYTQEIIVQVFSIRQTAVGSIVDFSGQTLLGASIFNQSSDSFNSFESVIFDNVTFNQDIFITLQDTQNADGGNYYLELEQYELDDHEATATILKNFRNTNSYQS